MSNVAKLELVSVGEGFRFDPDDLLEAAKGKQFLSGSDNVGETLILLEKAKHQTIFGDGDDG